MNELLTREAAVRQEATELLETTLLPLLKRYGDVEIGGSYLYKLMYQRDIDLILIAENVTKEKYADLCKEILLLDGVSTFKTTDRVDFPHQYGNDRPTGYWLSPHIMFNGNEWVVDIWLQKPAWVDGNNTRFLEALAGCTEEQRVQIIQLKKELKAVGNYGVGKDFQSVDVYNEVLKDQSVDDLRKYFGLKR